MEFAPRILLPRLKQALTPDRVITLLGPRRVGKTVLLRKWAGEVDQPYHFWNGEDLVIQEALARRAVTHYRSLIGDRSLLFMNEAQNIPDIGKVLKLMVDEIEGLWSAVRGHRWIRKGRNARFG
jgi:hypothetical protein